MIVVAIIGILAMIAIPAYLDYSIRSQVAHGINLAAGAKVSVAEYYQNQGEYPGDNVTAGLSGHRQLSPVNILPRLKLLLAVRLR